MIASLAQFAVNYSYGYNYNYTSTPSTHMSSGGWAALIIVYLIILVFVIVEVVATWIMFRKAGKPGWAAIIPFYNSWVLAEVGGKPGWWFILLCIPFVNIIFSLLIALGIAKNFGKSVTFGVVGLWLFAIIGYLILAFGPAKYSGNDNNAPSDQSFGPPAPAEGSEATKLPHAN